VALLCCGRLVGNREVNRSFSCASPRARVCVGVCCVTCRDASVRAINRQRKEEEAAARQRAKEEEAAAAEAAALQAKLAEEEAQRQERHRVAQVWAHPTPPAAPFVRN
jgi:hypothetical protein